MQFMPYTIASCHVSRIILNLSDRFLVEIRWEGGWGEGHLNLHGSCMGCGGLQR